MQKKTHNKRNFYRPKEEETRINERIRSEKIRLVGEDTNEIIETKKALEMAKEQNLDLVEISSKPNPPVCKIMDYSKFLFEQKKKKKINQKNASKTKIKEIKMTPSTDDHDIEFKLRHVENFLKKGNKVKLVVEYRGRQMAHKEIGEKLLLEFISRLEELAKVDFMPKMEGKRLMTMLTPRK